MAGDYDEREEELSSITAIFPEVVMDADKTFSASIDLPVAPSTPLEVTFLSDDAEGAKYEDKHTLEYLPPLHLAITLPDGYPSDKAPLVTLSTTPEWLPASTLLGLSAECAKLWEEYGQCQIVFSYIDSLQQAAERAFDLSNPKLPAALKAPLLDFNDKTKKAQFDAGTFDCGVCLEPKKGSSCHRLRRCGHVFCLACLQDFFNNCITEGDVTNVQCLDPGCAKAMAEQAKGNRKRKSQKTLHPKELLDMGISESMVRRYLEMKRKKRLEADKSTVYCPRSWCQGPARSTRYPPIPADVSQYPESSDSESDADETPLAAANTNNNNGKSDKVANTSDRLRICSKCTFAFCRICHSSWHGEFQRCYPRNPNELSEEEQASYNYILANTSPCPQCSAPSQKTHGCNHMCCSQCQTHFCYLCGFWLDGSNPYQHYNKAGSSCYNRLWELEEGDQGQDANFNGPRFWEQEAIRVAEEADRQEAERLQNEENAAAEEDDDVPAEGPAPPVAPLDPDLAHLVAHPDPNDPFWGGDDDDDFDWSDDEWFEEDDQRPRHWRNPRFQPLQPGRPRPARQRRPGLNIDAQARAQAQAGAPGAALVAGEGGNPVQLPHRPRAARPQAQARPPPPAPPAPAAAGALDPAAAAAFRRFLELAQRDEEDGWDSDELDEHGDAGWVIPAR